MTTSAVIASVILSLLHQRDPASSICPSDVARTLAEGAAQWRPLMPRVRDEARALARSGAIVITQRDAVLDPDTPLHGPLRLRRGPMFPEA
jgi:Protein of unknown function (DUF3253)